MVDTMGLLLSVVVHPADVQDRDGPDSGKPARGKRECRLSRWAVETGLAGWGGRIRTSASGIVPDWTYR